MCQSCGHDACAGCCMGGPTPAPADAGREAGWLKITPATYAAACESAKSDETPHRVAIDLHNVLVELDAQRTRAETAERERDEARAVADLANRAADASAKAAECETQIHDELRSRLTEALAMAEEALRYARSAQPSCAQKASSATCEATGRCWCKRYAARLAHLRGEGCGG